MKPILFDLKSSLVRKPLLFIVALTVVLTTASVYMASTPSPSTVSLPGVNLLHGYFRTGSNYTVVNYVFNSEGEPLSGYPFSININGTNYTSTTGSDGFANITLDLPSLDGELTLNETNRVCFDGITNKYIPAHITLNSTAEVSVSGLDNRNAYILPVNNPSNKYVVSLLIFYINPEGKAGNGLSISYAESNISHLTSEIYASSPTSQNKTILPDFNAYIFRPMVPVNQLKNNPIYSVTLRSGTGNILLSWYEQLVIKPTNASFDDMLSYLQYFVPLTALLIGFTGYGRDVASGVMESVISKPTTKVRIMISRYVASSLAMVFSVAVTVVFIFLLAYIRLNSFYSLIPFMSEYQWLSIFWIFGFEALAFLALMFLGSQVLRSETWQVYFSVAIYIFLDIIFIIGNQSDINISNVDNFLSPGGLLYLVTALSSAHSPGGVAIMVLPNNYLFYVFLDSLLWILAPLSLALAIARKW